ncbi:MAG: DUF1569 domain-containing protein [Vicinamibacterales bacterium]
MNDYLNRCFEIIETATAGVPDDLIKERADGRWSVLEIIEHLQLAYSGTAKGFDRCLEAGAPSAKRFSFADKVRKFVVVRAGYFPRGRQAPKFILPKGGVDLPTVVAGARRDLEWLDASATRARERFGAADVLDHPLLGAFSVDEWLRFHWIHTRHHEKQIRARTRR